jgi:hypothetical protein
MNNDDKKAVLAIFEAGEKPLEQLNKRASRGEDGRIIRLNLRGCWRLTTLPPEIGSLNELTELILSGCRNLTTLPPQIGQLSKLKELDLSYWKDLEELPSSLLQLAELNYLALRSTKLPDFQVFD